MTEKDFFGSMDDLLERERLALLNGDFASVPDLVTEKEALLERLADTEGLSNHRIDALKVKAHQNQALLDGALRGIQNVANRLATLRRIRGTLETYDESGRKSAVSAEEPSQVERRA